MKGSKQARRSILLWLVIAVFVAGFACMAAFGVQEGRGEPVAAEAQIQVDWSNVVGNGPSTYGVEYTWVDQDRDLFLERFRQLNPNLVRVQITQEYFEPQNDNPDPNVSEIDFGLTIPLDIQYGKTITYQDMFTALITEFPDMRFEINLWLAAKWNASDPDGYLGLGGAFPPLDYAEHEEFVRELAGWLVHTCGIPPAQLSISFINEPNLDPFFVGSNADLITMAAHTRAALDAVSPQIEMHGLDEVHGVSWTDTFYHDPGRGGNCCSAWTFHAYERGIDQLWSALQTRIQDLSPFGPVWVTEFADTNNGSPDGKMDFSTRSAALGFAELGGRLWNSPVSGVVHFRLSDMYLDSVAPLSGWTGHGLFADWRGTKSGGVSYEIYPSFWVFSNLYQYLGDGEVIAATQPPGLAVAAVRQGNASPPYLALWVTNPGSTPQSLDVQIDHFPRNESVMLVIDNLGGNSAIAARRIAGAPLGFNYILPAESSFTFLVPDKDPGLVATPTAAGGTAATPVPGTSMWIFLPVIH